MALVVQGAKRTVLGDREFNYGAGEYLVASIELPVTGSIVQASVDRPFLAFVLHLEPARIAELLLDAAPTPISTTSAPCALAVSRASAAILDASARLLGLLDDPRDLAALAPLYERELLWRLLVGEQGRVVREIGLTDGRLTQLGHAIGWIRANYQQPLSVAHLASLAAMSPRTFHRVFRATTRMTPLQYQKQLRLNEARVRLATRSQTIAGVGYDVGYGSPSQFSREYRRMFGTTPGTDPGPTPDGVVKA